MPRRAVLEGDLSATLYCAVLVIARGWFAVSRMAFLKAGDSRDQLMAARREGPAGDGAAHYVVYLTPTARDAGHVERIVRQAVTADGGSLDAILEPRWWDNFMTRVTSDAIASGRYMALEDRQGTDNVWLCNSIIAHENWRDLLALSQATAARIAAAA